MLEEIYSRRSIRKYTSEPISRSIIEKIIDAGRVAPSAKNRQPWKYLVYSGEAKARLLSIMKKGIEMEEIHPRHPLSVNGIPDAKNTGLIHHSDRGCQYCSKEYVKLLTDNGIRISMTEKGDPYENAVAERVNGILKSEWIDEECFESFQAAKERIDQIVILYNSLRPHASCDWLTPLEAELRTGKLKHHWGRKTVVRKAYVNLYQDNIF